MSIKKWIQVFRNGLTPGKIMPHQFSFLVKNPLRSLILSPTTLADRLNITPEMNILELGCGSGFFSPEFDVVFLETVFGELSDPETTLREVGRVLKPNGLLSISKHRTDPDFTSFENLRSMLEKYGVHFRKKYGWKWNYTANFTNFWIPK